MAQIFNFSSGPASLLGKRNRSTGTARLERSWYVGDEVSHRGKEFIQVAEEAEKDFRDLLNVPFQPRYCSAMAAVAVSLLLFR